MSETITILCSCGEELDTSWSSKVDGAIVIDPCNKCLEAAKKESRQEGYDEGRESVE